MSTSDLGYAPTASDRWLEQERKMEYLLSCTVVAINDLRSGMRGATPERRKELLRNLAVAADQAADEVYPLFNEFRPPWETLRSVD